MSVRTFCRARLINSADCTPSKAAAVIDAMLSLGSSCGKGLSEDVKANLIRTRDALLQLHALAHGSILSAVPAAVAMQEAAPLKGGAAGTGAPPLHKGGDKPGGGTAREQLAEAGRHRGKERRASEDGSGSSKAERKANKKRSSSGEGVGSNAAAQASQPSSSAGALEVTDGVPVGRDSDAKQRKKAKRDAAEGTVGSLPVKDEGVREAVLAGSVSEAEPKSRKKDKKRDKKAEKAMEEELGSAKGMKMEEKEERKGEKEKKLK